MEVKSCSNSKIVFGNCWSLYAFYMYSVVRWVFPDVSTDFSAFIFNSKQSTAWPWRRRHHTPLKSLQLLTHILQDLSKWLWEPQIFQCIVCLCFRWSRGSGARRCHETRPRNWKAVAVVPQRSVPHFTNNVKRTCSCCWEAAGAPYLPYCSGQPAAEVYDSAAYSVSHGTSRHGLWVDRTTHRGLWLPIWKLMSLLRLVRRVIMQS